MFIREFKCSCMKGPRRKCLGLEASKEQYLSWSKYLWFDAIKFEIYDI